MENLIIKYLNEIATVQEKYLLFEWLKCSNDNKKKFREIQQIWLASENAEQKETKTAQAYNLLKESIEVCEQRKKIMFKLSLFKTIAAASVLLAIFSLGGFLLGEYSTNPTQLQSQVFNNVIMGRDSKGVVTLPDGTKVWLNSQSKLIYPEKFSEKARIVKLEGEGYFDVMKNPKVPFYVETDKMKVRVLGTQFDLKNYPNRTSMETTLLSGKVEVLFNDLKTSVILEPNQKISINKTTGKHAIEEFNAKYQILWANEQLVFSNERLSDILQSIGFWYGLKIIPEGKIDLNQRLSLTIRKESKEETLKLLSLIAPIKYEIGIEEIIVRPQ